MAQVQLQKSCSEIQFLVVKAHCCLPSILLFRVTPTEPQCVAACSISPIWINSIPYCGKGGGDPADEMAAPGEYQCQCWLQVKPRVITCILRNIFSVRVIYDWNSFPVAMVCSNVLNQFQNCFDLHSANIDHLPPQAGR